MSVCGVLPLELSGFSEVTIDLKDEIGKGNFSTVYRAKCDQLTCAAKRLDCVSEKNLAVKIEMQCQLLSIIRHPNIVHYLGTVRHAFLNHPILLLEHMEENLTQFIQRFPSFIPYHIKVNICHDIALGLAYLHRKDKNKPIIHGNLSSNNILIVGESRAKISDFWMLELINTAVSYDPQSQMNLSHISDNKIAYMAPESRNNPPTFDMKSDVYAYGVLVAQVDTQYVDPKDAEIAGLREHTPPHSVMMHLALSCLQDDPSLRPFLESVCQYISSSLRNNSDYTSSIKESRECNIKLQKYAEQVRLKDDKIIDMKKAMNDRELVIVSLSEENDEIIQQNKQYESLVHHLHHQSMTAVSQDQLPGSSVDQDQPDSSSNAAAALATPEPDENHEQITSQDVIIPHEDLQLVTDQLLGEGKFGMTYGGTWNGREIAFKKLKLQSKLKPEKMKSLLQHEIKYLRRLQHPNIVRVYGVTLDDDNVGIVLEHLSCSLFHVLFCERRELPESKRRSIVRQISEGLVYLHRKDIVHCHLTAKNILLSCHNTAKIGNYGPKFVRSFYNSNDDLVGDFDPSYSAPEIREALPKKEKMKADVYSLGMITYVVMSMREPYDGLVPRILSKTEEELHSTLFQGFQNSHLVLDILRRSWDMNIDKRPTAPEFVKTWREC